MEQSKNISPDSIFSFTVGEQDAGMRLDTYISNQFPAYSRSFFQGLIKQQLVQINTAIAKKPSLPIQAGDQIEVRFPPTKTTTPQPIDPSIKVDIIFEHEHFLIVNKPAGLLVHKPSDKSIEVTLVDWLLTHFSELQSVGSSDRPGIVHRLDKDTSGLMIITRTPYAHLVFGNLFKERALIKTYLAVVQGHPPRNGIIDRPMARSKTHRNQMISFALDEATNLAAGKIRNATTEYEVLDYFEDTSLVSAHLITGRTHQIRVHFANTDYPLIGDTVYGQPSKLIKRQALHAYSIAFTFDGTPYSFKAEPPEDFQKLVAKLRAK